ncbi:hypothetical protein HY024_03505 [Candidatus Curtissbacteria bacterium]|nr:hypothetical protein [Candidatus Curtissbacteria bacterium]
MAERKHSLSNLLRTQEAALVVIVLSLSATIGEIIHPVENHFIDTQSPIIVGVNLNDLKQEMKHVKVADLQANMPVNNPSSP